MHRRFVTGYFISQVHLSGILTWIFMVGAVNRSDKGKVETPKRQCPRILISELYEPCVQGCIAQVSQLLTLESWNKKIHAAHEPVHTPFLRAIYSIYNVAVVHKKFHRQTEERRKK